MSTKRGVIALDIGTTGVKAMLITLQGEVVSSGYCEYSSTYPQPGYVEQSAKEILNKTYEACAKMMRETDGSEPICFVLSSQRSTLVRYLQKNCFRKTVPVRRLFRSIPTR